MGAIPWGFESPSPHHAQEPAGLPLPEIATALVAAAVVAEPRPPVLIAGHQKVPVAMAVVRTDRQSGGPPVSPCSLSGPMSSMSCGPWSVPASASMAPAGSVGVPRHPWSGCAAATFHVAPGCAAASGPHGRRSQAEAAPATGSSSTRSDVSRDIRGFPLCQGFDSDVARRGFTGTVGCRRSARGGQGPPPFREGGQQSGRGAKQPTLIPSTIVVGRARKPCVH